MHPILPLPAPVVVGDGAATLYQADALHVLANLPADSVDHAIMDPPYCSGGTLITSRKASPGAKYALRKTVRRYADFPGDTRDQRSFTTWCTLWGSLCWRAMRPGGFFLCFTDWRQLPAVTDAVQAAGFIWRGIVVWDKTEACRPDKGQFRRQAEFVVVATKGRPVIADDAPCLPGVFRHMVRPSDKFHLTGKPSALMADLVRIARPGEMILDAFMGSGTTGAEALKRGCSFIGVEQSAEIFPLAVQRIAAVWEAATAHA